MANKKRYASLSTLQNLVDNIKTFFVKKADLETALSGYDTKGSAAAVQENLNVVSDTVNSHTANTNIHFTSDERAKLAGIAAGAQVNTVTGVKGNSESTYRTGNINITKANIGLGNVDNTADANKNVNHASTADSATSAVKATQDGNGNVISSTYETKTDADAKLASAKSYTDTKVSGLASTSTVDSKISTHNTSASAHNDIRDLISGLTTRLNTLANSDDTTLDQMSEVVAYIKNNKSLIDGITTSKINVSDIVNNLTTNVANKPLSAAQGVVINNLINTLQEDLDSHGHVISDIDGLTTTLANKAEKYHGTHVVYLVADPLMDGDASAGLKNEVARADHRHPTDTSRAAKTDLDALEEVVAGKASSTHTHTHASLGQGMGYCSTAAATTAKVVSLPNYELKEGGVVTVEFVYGVPASATMNINSKGAQSIYYKGKAIESDVIKGGDRATFMYYSLRYHLISIDRWHKDIVDLQTNDRKVEQKVVTANANYPLLLAQYSQTADTTGFSYFDSGVYLNPSTNTIKANVDGTATGLKNLTATISELNHMDGVTSNVQTQLNNKCQVQIITYEADD